jgi:hypothetical protein
MRIITKDPRTLEVTLKGVFCHRCADDLLEFLNRIKSIHPDLITVGTSKKDETKDDD